MREKYMKLKVERERYKGYMYIDRWSTHVYILTKPQASFSH